MSEVTIRLAEPGDEVAVALLIDRMDEYYGDSPRPDGETRATVAGWLAAGEARFALAYVGDQPAGIASFGVLYPGNNLKRLLYLKDLFVAVDWRDRQVGERLMRFLARYCRDHGIGRMDWETETDRAERFYARLGATVLAHKRHMRLDGSALAALAED